jgi:hypothetical protein
VHLFLVSLIVLCSRPTYAETAIDLWESFKKNPNSHEFIPNNSFAGYSPNPGTFDPKRGAVVINFPPAKDQKSDSLEIFETLLNKAPPDVGVTIVFPEREYQFSRQIRVQRSKVRIRGAGPGKTIFKFTKPLWEILPAKLADGRSPFAWSRGLVEVSPKFKLDHDFNGWEEGKYLASVTGAFPVGAQKIQAKSKSGLKAGFYLLQWSLESKRPVSYMAGKENDLWLAGAKHWKNRKFLRWPVWVKPGKGGVLELAQPLRLPILPTDRVDLYELPHHLGQIEISDLTIETNRSVAAKHLQEKGFNAFFFHRVIGGIIHNVEVKNVDNAFLLNAVKNVTLRKVSILGDLSTHHGTFHKYADDCLVEEFSFTAPMIHGLNADLRGSGNVWRAGQLKYGTVDMHRGMQFDLIRTNIEFATNSGDSGGDADAGPMQGRRVVHWNLRVGGDQWKNIFEPDLFPFGALVGIRARKIIPAGNVPIHTKVIDINNSVLPADLYSAQVELLGTKKLGQ